MEKNFHVCYMVGTLCTGVTLTALSYADAIKKFEDVHGADVDIIYVSILRP